MVSELNAPHPRHSILKAWLLPHHVTSGAWTCSAELAGIVNLHGAKTSLKLWHCCWWLQMEIFCLQPSITVKGSHLFLMRLISNNWNAPPPPFEKFWCSVPENESPMSVAALCFQTLQLPDVSVSDNCWNSAGGSTVSAPWQPFVWDTPDGVPHSEPC